MPPRTDYDLRLKLETLDKTGKTIDTVENVAAYLGAGVPADTPMWFVEAQSLRTEKPKPGDRITDGGGVVWKVTAAHGIGGGSRWVVEARKP